MRKTELINIGGKLRIKTDFLLAELERDRIKAEALLLLWKWGLLTPVKKDKDNG